MRTTTNVPPRRPLAAFAAALAALAIASLGLAACGGSSGQSGSSNATTGDAAVRNAAAAKAQRAFRQQPHAAKSSTPATGTLRRPGAFRECLSKNGVKLPAGHNGLLLGGAALPKNVDRRQLQAAMRKCLGGRFQGAGGPGQRPGVGGSGPGAVRFRQALAKFAACLRQNGVNLPAPNTGGHGPMFSTKGVNTASPQFRAATAKCRTALTGALRGRP